MMTLVICIFAEYVQHKVDLLVERQQMLGDREYRLE